MRNKTDWILFDVRTAAEYTSGHIPGAESLPLGRLRKECKKRIPSKSMGIIVYCRSGVRSRIAAVRLKKFGYSNVLNLGSIRNWNGEIIKE